MLLIKDYDKERNHRTLSQDEKLFHDALACVIKGEKRFHVRNGNGPDYDLEYVENQSWCEASKDYPDSPLFRQEPLYPPYLIYDETCRERICFDILEGTESIWFEEVNEYTVVLTGIILRYTKLTVLWKDERIQWFFPNEPRIILSENDPGSDSGKTLRVVRDFFPSAFSTDYNTMDQVVLFHHFFVYQWLTDLPFDQVKYAEIMVAKSEGIGSALTVYGRTRHFLERFGIRVTLQPGSSRYPDSIIDKYFTIPMTPEDADASNTIYITNYYGLLFTKMLRLSSGNDFDISMLDPVFLSEMEEYAEAALKDKRWLGVLLRGSDFIASGMSGACAPVTVESALPKIREWMEEGNYDGIFLATEDLDIMDQMIRAFPGKIRAVSQERYSIKDFKDVTTISELDRKRHPGEEEYDRFIEDSTANYFYALYLLSKCENFMYSGQCGGIVMAKAMKQGSYRRMYCFNENREIKTEKTE